MSGRSGADGAGHGRAFLDESAELLAESFLPRIRRSVEVLDSEQLWWRPNEASNGAGHLLLHLEGNLRQWIVSGVGGAPDTRRRALEFEPETRPRAGELLDRLGRSVAEAADVLRSVDPSRLGEVRTVQGQEVTVLEAVYHAVEHFSMHTGQIIYVAKALRGSAIDFYEVRDGIAKPRW